MWMLFFVPYILIGIGVIIYRISPVGTLQILADKYFIEESSCKFAYLQRIGVNNLYADVHLAVCEDGFTIRLPLGKSMVFIPIECIEITEKKKGMFQYISVRDCPNLLIGLQEKWIKRLRTAAVYGNKSEDAVYGNKSEDQISTKDNQ